MILSGTQLVADVRSPVFSNLIAAPVTVTIRDDGVEIGNVEDTEVNTSVVGAEFDIQGSDIAYRVIAGGGFFSDVNDATGFNGYRLQFLALSDGNVQIRDVLLVDAENTLGIAASRIGFSRDTVTMNVDGLGYSFGQRVLLRMGFEISGSGRADVLSGETGRDHLIGRGGADVLAGGGEDDLLVGGNGDDVLSGDAGRDTLVGGNGVDVFVLAEGSGRDRVKDFDPAVDVVRIDGPATVFEDLLIRETGSGVLVRDGQHSLLLIGVTLDDVDAGFFEF